MAAQAGEHAPARLYPVPGGQPGAFRIAGAVGFDTVTALLRASERAFVGHAELAVDLAEVTHADSAGLALLLLWVERATRNGARIRFAHPPAALTQMARMSEVEALLDPPR